MKSLMAFKFAARGTEYFFSLLQNHIITKSLFLLCFFQAYSSEFIKDHGVKLKFTTTTHSRITGEFKVIINSIGSVII